MREHTARLKLSVSIPFQIAVDERILVFPVLLRAFGAPKGMILVTRYEDVRPYTYRLGTLGYGYSCLSEPNLKHAEDDIALIEMLQEWGWYGTHPPPAWLSKRMED